MDELVLKTVCNETIYASIDDMIFDFLLEIEKSNVRKLLESI